MTKVQNLTNSPYIFNGTIIPARGTAELDLPPEGIAKLRQIGYFKVLDDAPEPSPDPDPDPASQDQEPDLREQYTALTGRKPDKRWGDARLRAEIDKA